MTTECAGFIGLGLMGEPMAAGLARAGHRLSVWNRSAGPAERLAALGARCSAGPAEVFAQCDPVFLMLRDGTAIDTVLGRRDGRIDAPVAGRTVVQLGTESPSYSAALAADLAAAGAGYLESRCPDPALRPSRARWWRWSPDLTNRSGTHCRI